MCVIPHVKRAPWVDKPVLLCGLVDKILPQGWCQVLRIEHGAMGLVGLTLLTLKQELLKIVFPIASCKISLYFFSLSALTSTKEDWSRITGAITWVIRST